MFYYLRWSGAWWLIVIKSGHNNWNTKEGLTLRLVFYNTKNIWTISLQSTQYSIINMESSPSPQLRDTTNALPALLNKYENVIRSPRRQDTSRIQFDRARSGAKNLVRTHDRAEQWGQQYGCASHTKNIWTISLQSTQYSSSTRSPARVTQ